MERRVRPYRPTEELRIRLLNLFRLVGDVAGESDLKLHRSSLPHSQTSDGLGQKEARISLQTMIYNIATGASGPTPLGTTRYMINDEFWARKASLSKSGENYHNSKSLCRNDLHVSVFCISRCSCEDRGVRFL